MSSDYVIPVGFRNIPKADNRYVVADNGQVFNLKTKKPLKPQWTGYRSYVTVKDPEGRQFRFDPDKIDDPQYKPFTKDWVLNVDKAKIIPEYPDYAVSHYGAIYRINPRAKGPRAGEVYMIKEHTRKGFPYAILRLENGKRKPVRSDLLTERVWGDESTVS